MLSYTDHGKGEAIVFLHGYCESKAIWSQFDTALSKIHRIVCIDLPGYGDSEAIEHLSMETMAESVYEVLNSLKLSKLILIGHSMGGYVALAFAEKHPGMLSGLVLFHSTAYADSDERKAQRNKTINYLQEYGVEAFIRPFVPPLFYPPNRERCKDAIQKLIEIGLRTPLKVIADSAAAMRDRPDRSHILTDAVYPVLFIVGKNDSSVKPDDSLAQSQLPSEAYVQLLGETGHQGLFEREVETVKMLEAFVKIAIK